MRTETDGFDRRILTHQRLGSLLGVIAIALAMILPAPRAESQVEPEAGPPANIPEDLLQSLNLERLGAMKQAAQEATDLPEPQKTELIQQYDLAMRALEATQTYTAEARQFQSEIDAAPTLLDQLQAELRQPIPDPERPPDAPVSQLEQGLAEIEAELQTALEAVTKLERDITFRSQRRDAIPTELATARQRLQAANDDLTEVAAGDLVQPVTRARALRLLAERRQQQARIEQLETERRWLDARRETLRARLDRARRRVTIAEQRAEVWRPIVAQKREQAARAAEQEARATLQGAEGESDEFKRLAEENAKLAALRSDYAKRLTAAEDRLTQDRRLKAEIRAQFSDSYDQVRQAGLTDTMGLVLRARRAALPNVRDLRRDIDQRQVKAAEALSTLFELQDRHSADTVSILADLEREMGSAAFAEGRQKIEELVREVVNTRSDVIELLDDYTSTLNQLDSQELALIALTEDYANFIDERVLWIQSHETINIEAILTAVSGLTAIVHPDLWTSLGASAWNDLRSDPLDFAPPALVLLAWLVLVVTIRPRIIRTQEATTKKVESSRLNPSFLITLQGLGLTVVEAAIRPSLLLVLATFFNWPANAPSAAGSIADALLFTAAVYYVIEFIRRAARERRLARVHFGWPRDAANVLRRNLTWLAIPFLPLVFILRLTSLDADGLGNEEAARIAFILINVIAGIFILRTFRPHGAVLGDYLAEHAQSWMARLRLVWFSIFVGLPFVLALLAAIGYYYSAQELNEQLRWTFLLVLGLILAAALFNRWIWVARRRVAIDQARKKRAALAQQQQQEREGDSAPRESASEVNVVEETEIDLPAANEQASQLFRSAAALTLILGLWFIWIDVLPALEILNRFELWPEFGPVAAVDPEAPESLRQAAPESFGEPDAADTTSETDAAPPPPANGGPTGDATTMFRPGGPVTTVAEQTAEETDLLEEDRVMLGELGLAILLIMVTVVATKNIPGLLEILLLQRLPLDSGARYAVTTIARYCLMILGIMLVFGAIGIGWSKVQWLVAALTFGLAFGLQEIFANFMSGIIILIERPMRVGDTITIRDITGEVARIRMRATTITQWNRKELVVPNKDFITGELVNWTLSDPVLRIEIPIGIAYGSDTRKARDLLLEIANRQENVLADPPPRAVFVGFGDNSLNFELRIFIPHISYLIDVRDQVLFVIDDEFRKAGIEIAFPQRDIHIRTVTSALDVRRLDQQDKNDRASEAAASRSRS